MINRDYFELWIMQRFSNGAWMKIMKICKWKWLPSLNKRKERQHCPTSHKGFLHVIYNLVVVTNDGVSMEKDGHLLAQVQPHEPGLLVLLQWQAHIPLLTDKTLLINDEPYLKLQRTWLVQTHPLFFYLITTCMSGNIFSGWTFAMCY